MVIPHPSPRLARDAARLLPCRAARSSGRPIPASAPRRGRLADTASLSPASASRSAPAARGQVARWALRARASAASPSRGYGRRCRAGGDAQGRPGCPPPRLRARAGSGGDGRQRWRACRSRARREGGRRVAASGCARTSHRSAAPAGAAWRRSHGVPRGRARGRGLLRPRQSRGSRARCRRSGLSPLAGLGRDRLVRSRRPLHCHEATDSAVPTGAARDARGRLRGYHSRA